jgi:hypothetical protein
MADYRTTTTKENGGTRITSGNMTATEAARMQKERKDEEGLSVEDKAAAASAKLDKETSAKKRFDAMQQQLVSGAVKDMTLEQQEAFIAEYKKLKDMYSFAQGGKACRGRKAMGSAEKS